MTPIHLTLPQKSVLYATKTFIGAATCWLLLTWAGITNPIWSVITVVLVSDPDLNTARTLVIARVINTIVGCTIGLSCLFLFGYSPWTAITVAALTVLVITSIEYYPTNWRLAPVTVLILFDASRAAETHGEQFHYALLRASEIGLGSMVALLLALLYTRVFTGPKPPRQAPTE